LTQTPDTAPARTRSPRPRPPATTRARGAAARAPRPSPRPAPRPAPKKVAPQSAHIGRRIGFCSALVIIVFGLLAARLAQLQVMSGDRYTRLAVAQTLHSVPISAERGSIFDRNGHDLALSIERPTVYADPTLVNDPAGEATQLAPVLGVDQTYLLKQLTAKPSRFAYLAHTVSDATAAAVKHLNLPGIGFTTESARSYPADALAGSVLGNVGSNGNGLDGIEYLYNAMLEGKPGVLQVDEDPDGHDIPNTAKTKVAAHRGTDLVLSIDEDLQWQAEQSLLDEVKATQAKGGMAAVVDVQTGDLLASATIEGANATTPVHVAAPTEHNAPLTDLFAPGSTTKLITLSTALEHGDVTPTMPFSVPYSIKVDSNVAPFYDAEWHPTQEMTTADILRQSSNVGTIKIAERMTNQELADGVRAFGLGSKTSVPWPGQPNGLILPPTQYYATGKYSTAIGYGAAVTGMQMLDAFTTIANGGETRPPRLLDATIDASGERHDAAPTPGTRVVSPNTAQLMTNMMEGVVANGTGACAAVPGYPVAGKTGTSKTLGDGGQYSQTETMASFIGFAPADHPRFAAIVVLNENNPTYQFGGASAAPVWSEIMQFALTQYGVPPTDASNAQYNSARAAAQYNCSVPHGPQLAQIIANNAATPPPGTPGTPGGGGGSTTPPSEPGKNGGTGRVRSATSPSN
jgi:cell division protein FtsI (penicillin-binding protein 3)